MDYKYVHAAFKQFNEYFKRSFMMIASEFKSTYGFASDVPYIGNRVILDYDHTVYNYEPLLQIDDVALIDSVQITGINITKLKVEEFDNIIRKNIAVAAHMKELEETAALLKDLEAL